MPPSARDDFDGARLAELPAILEAPPSERSRLVRQKLRLCCKVYDFRQPNKDVREKKTKEAALMELIEYVSSGKNVWAPGIAAEVIHTVSCNIFRPLGQKPLSKNEPKEEDEESLREPAWPHLHLVYDLLLRLVLSKEVDSKTAKEYFSKRFMTQFLNLLDSEDSNEREYLKTILHRIYGKSMALRGFIRRSINNIFYTFVYETEKFNGIAELLEILGSIINGFALPLKMEHLKFLEKTLLPLHKIANMAPFHQQLSYCIVQFVDKDPKTAIPIINGLLRFWPVTTSSKELLFLNELEEILELTKAEEFAKLVRPLFQQIARSMASLHFQVAQRALYLWNNEYIVNMVVLHRVEILPIIFDPILENSRTHWHS